jgi:predicted Zn-ribbon and HTH transcriptional regulator
MPKVRNQRATNVDYYRRNREREIFRVRVRQVGTVEMLREMRDVPCADCGERFEPHQMDFDHRDPKSKSFTIMSGRASLKSRGVLLAEVAKCDVVCANCHAVRSQRQSARRWANGGFGTSPRIDHRRRYWRSQAQKLLELRSVPCQDCSGVFSPYSMEFDHRDPCSKSQRVMAMVGRAGIRRILEEVAKCDVVCANCHRMRTFRRREVAISERE